MTFTLKLMFTGMIAFVPLKAGQVMYEVSPGNQPDQVVVLFVDAREGSSGCDDPSSSAHFPVIRYDEDDSKGPRASNFDCSGIPEIPGQACKGIMLYDEHLEIELGENSSDIPLKVVTGNRIEDGDLLRKRPCCTDCVNETEKSLVCLGETTPVAEQFRDFSWVVSLSEVLPGTMINSRAWLPVPPAGLISARMTLETGTLETLLLEGEKFCLPTDPDERYKVVEPVKFVPSPKGSSWPVASEKEKFPGRAVAERVVLTIPGIKDHVTLRSRRLDPNNPFGDFAELMLAPRESCPGSCVVEVELINSPCDLIYDRCPDEYSHRHFEMLWDLVVAPPAPRPAPDFSDPGGPEADLLCPEVRP
jgi:hypothetical protein